MRIVSTVSGLASASLCLAFATGCPGSPDQNTGGSGGANGYSVSVVSTGTSSVQGPNAVSATQGGYSTGGSGGCENVVSVSTTGVTAGVGEVTVGITSGGDCGFSTSVTTGGCGDGSTGMTSGVTTIAAATVVSTVSTGGYGVPWEWTCEPFLYGEGNGCDCGCGAPDPDCADTTLGSCTLPAGNCFQTGSCGQLSSPGCGFIDPYNNAYCIPAYPENSAAACADGVDNDQDGLIDSDDPDCAPAP